ncbi:WD40 repeat domain-containing protein [Frankia sp. QA3]|uniref:WD40 repeat domain-containing protein n=1 Tax=Frankia sp. QA3 TaxID=710111 RepID=UPI0012F88354|nr:WD40 repeat domain-containing protein [Frankia sp. QA3]
MVPVPKVMPDSGRLITAARDGIVRVWDPDTDSDQPVSEFEAWPQGVVACAVSADGSRLAAVGPAETVVWRVDDGSRLTQLAAKRVHHCAFSPDGRHLMLVGADGSVRRWDLAAGPVDPARHTRTIASGTGPVYACAFSPEGAMFVTAGQDTLVRLWNPHAVPGRPVVLHGHREPVAACAFAPTGELLTGGSDGDVRVWAVPRDVMARASTRSAHIGWVNCCAYAADGRALVVGAENGTTFVRSAPAGRGGGAGWGGDARREFPAELAAGGPAAVRACATGPGSLFATAGMGHVVRVWDAAAGPQPVHRLEASGISDLTGCAISPDGRHVAAVGNDVDVRLWAIGAGRDDGPQRLRGHTDAVRTCAFDARGTLLATGGNDHVVRLWKVPSGQSHMMLSGHRGTVSACAFSPDGDVLVTGGFDHSIMVWDLLRQSSYELTDHDDLVTGVAFAPDGRRFASVGRDRRIMVWQAADPAAPYRICDLPVAEPLAGVAWGADNRIAAVGHGGVYEFELVEN